MYSYGAGSPGTYGHLAGPRPIDVMGPGYGTYLQMEHPLSYAPRFSGYGQEAAPATGESWSDIINTVIGAGAALYQGKVQRDLATQARHEAARDRAAQLELARTQQLYLQSQSIKPAAGMSVMVPAGAPMGMGRTAMVVGGVVVVGGILWALTRKRRR